MIGKDKDWKAIFKLYDQTGLSAQEFSNLHGLTMTQFRYLRKKYSPTTQPIPKQKEAFEPVIISSMPIKERTRILIQLPNNIRCELDVDVHQQLILLKGLVSLC